MLARGARPSVDLPAPRSPTSAIRRARSVGGVPRGAALDQLGDAQADRRAAAGRSRSRMWVIAAVRPLARGMQLDDRHVERLRDRLQDDHRRVALPALDLREIALGRARILRQLASGHAALGAREPHQPTDRGGECLLIEAVGLGSLRVGI